MVLCGEIEDYYPDVDVGKKVGAAIEFSAEDYECGKLRECFVELPNCDQTDVEAFFNKVFQTE